VERVRDRFRMPAARRRVGPNRGALRGLWRLSRNAAGRGSAWSYELASLVPSFLARRQRLARWARGVVPPHCRCTCRQRCDRKGLGRETGLAEAQAEKVADFAVTELSVRWGPRLSVALNRASAQGLLRALGVGPTCTTDEARAPVCGGTGHAPWKQWGRDRGRGLESGWGRGRGGGRRQGRWCR